VGGGQLDGQRDPPVEQGEGDSVVGALGRASDAVAATLAAQRALVGERWLEAARLRTRMAVHPGEAELRGEGNYFGPAVIRCARLQDIGYGGQVLVSQATADLVGKKSKRSDVRLEVATLSSDSPHREDPVYQNWLPDPIEE
jgi:class 3 adenylate cyclase